MFLRSLFAAALLAFSPLAFSQTSRLVVQGDPGDYITGGGTINVTGLSGAASTNGGKVGFSYSGDREWWYLDFAAPAGQTLKVGSYPNALRFPFNGDKPGLSLTGTGRGCNQLTGSFEILDIKLGPAGVIERFHATFVQNCEGNPPRAVGEIFYEDNVVRPALEVTLTQLPDATLVSNRTEARLLFQIRCSAMVFINGKGTLRQRVSPRLVLSGPIAFSTLCTTTPATIEIPVLVTSHRGARWQRGHAQVDTTASAPDPYYGNDVTDVDSGIVRLTPVR